MNEIVSNVADFVLLSVIIPNLIFVVRYFLFSPYEITKEGRNLLYQKLAMTSLAIVITLSLWFGAEYPGRPWIKLAVFGAITFFFWTETINLIQVQRQYPWSRFKWLKKRV